MEIPLGLKYQICYQILTLIFLILAILAYIFDTNDFQIIKQQIISWNKDVIVDVQFKKYDSKCPPHYDSQSVYQWPGSIEGCDCRKESRNVTRILQDQNNITSARSRISHSHSSHSSHNSHANELDDKIYKKKCTSYQSSYNCQKIDDTSSNDFKYWESNGQLFQICTQKIKGYDLIHQFTQNQGQQCQFSQKYCGSRYNYFFFCVPSDMPCPIVRISQTQGYQYDLISSELEDIELYYTRQEKFTPIIDFQSTYIRGFCTNKDQLIHPYLNQSYPLIKKEYS